MTQPDEILDLNLLNTFLAVVEQRGFGAAARRIGISQPSVSQQMRRLEDKLGHRLFVREGSGTAVTSDGEALVIFARAMFSVADQVRAYFGQPGVEGSLKVGFNEDFAQTALPSVLNIFARSYQRIELLIDCNFDGEALFAELDKGRLDLVVAKLPETRIRGEVLWRERLVWVGRSRDQRWTEDPVQLVGHASALGHRLSMEALADAKRSWRVRFQSSSFGALEAAVCAGLGVGVVMRGLRLREIVALDDACGLPPLPEVAFCLDERRGAAAHVGAFASLLRATVLQLRPEAAAEGGRG